MGQPKPHHEQGAFAKEEQGENVAAAFPSNGNHVGYLN